MVCCSGVRTGAGPASRGDGRGGGLRWGAGPAGARRIAGRASRGPVSADGGRAWTASGDGARAVLATRSGAGIAGGGGGRAAKGAGITSTRPPGAEKVVGLASGRDRSGHSDPIGSILSLTLTTLGLVRAFAGGSPCTVADPPPAEEHGGAPRHANQISRVPVACCSRRIQPPRSNSCKHRATCPGEYPHRSAIDRLQG